MTEPLSVELLERLTAEIIAWPSSRWVWCEHAGRRMTVREHILFHQAAKERR